MEALVKTKITQAEFIAWTTLPQNAERRFEWVLGEVIEVPSNIYSSHIATNLIMALKIFIHGKALGYVTTEQGGYQIGEELYAPDVAYISRTRQPELPQSGFNPQPPELAVEVVSPSDSERVLLIKVANYLAAGTTVWVVYPATREVAICRPGQPIQVLGEGDTLSGDPFLPGFTLAVSAVFSAT